MHPLYVVLTMNKLEKHHPSSSMLPPEHSPLLLTKILRRIKDVKQRRAQQRCITYLVFTLLSIIGFAPALQYFRTELLDSGLPQLLSLLFSDPTIMLTYWQEFTFSILELLPVAGLTAILGSLFVFLGTLRLTAKQMEHLSTRPQPL